MCKRLSFSEIQSSKWHSYRCVYESGAAKALVVQTRQSAMQASVVQTRPGAPFLILFFFFDSELFSLNFLIYKKNVAHIKFFLQVRGLFLIP
jgi:hypothetical protein